MDWPIGGINELGVIIAAFYAQASEFLKHVTEIVPVGAVAVGYIGGKAGAKEDAKPSDTSSGKDQQSPPSGG